MKRIAQLSATERNDLFTNTASKMGLNSAIIEKDFWVCWILDYLFHRSAWKNNLAFKGGTSLSKAYSLIERFSEDIDLILDWRILGYTANEPWEERSNTQQDRFNKEALGKTEHFLREQFLPLIRRDLSDELGREVNMQIDETDGQTILFSYPHDFAEQTILQHIRLEVGALAAWTPAQMKTITPYAAEQYPHIFEQPCTEVLTVLPERTFWEKITILHREANRPQSSPFPQRYSRHYYDTYCLAASTVKDTALKDLGLLRKVVEFKEKFYRSPWAKYEDAHAGSIKLMPPDYYLSVLQEDYTHMQNMLFGDKPTFEALMIRINELEHEINALPIKV